MTKEQLLRERYEPIFINGKHYPKSIYKEGEIITVGRSGDYIFCDTDGPRMSEYPHLFRRLEWWYGRRIEDMPEYVVTDYKDTANAKGLIGNGIFFKVQKWVTDEFFGVDGVQVLAHLVGYKPAYLDRMPGEDYGRVNACHLLPATEQEYNEYINSTKVN